MKPTEIEIPTPKQAQHILSQFELQPNGCSYWLDGCQSSGYGVVGYGYRTYLVHRVVWTIFNGTIPDDTLVLHKCEKDYAYDDMRFKRCGQLEHLMLGTYLDNSHDRIMNGRERKGDQRGGRNHRARINGATVLRIHELRKEGLTLEVIGEIVGTSFQNVSFVLNWKRWEHLRPVVEAALRGG